MRSVRTFVLALVAALVVVGCGGGGGESGTENQVSLVGTADFTYSQEEVTAQAGEISFQLSCEGAQHDITIEGENGGEPVVSCNNGQTSTGTISLEAGTYTFFCSVTGHRDAGMEGTLTVEG